MTFSRTFDVKRYGQIVIIKKQNDEGSAELRFFFQPEGFGVCDFAIGWKEGAPEDMADKALKQIVPREAIEIVDGYMKEMESKQRGMN